MENGPSTGAILFLATAGAGSNNTSASAAGSDVPVYHSE